MTHKNPRGNIEVRYEYVNEPGMTHPSKIIKKEIL